MRPLTAISLVVALVAASSPAAARTLALAPFSPLGIPAADARKVQHWFVRSAGRLPVRRWIMPKRLRRQLRQRPDCTSSAPCLAAVARRVGAWGIVRADVGSIGGAFVVYLSLIKKNGKRVRSVDGLIDPRAPATAAVPLLYRLLLPARYTGALEIAVNLDNAWIYLDGRRVARGRRAVVDKVPVGTHALRITHDGYRDFVQFVEVGFQRRERIAAKLTPLPVLAKEMRLASGKPLTDAELPWYRRWWAVAAFGAVLFASAATAVALIPRAVSHDREMVVRPAGAD